MKNFFKSINNLLAFAMGLIPTLFTVIFQPSFKVPFAVCLTLIYVSILCLWYAFCKRAELKECENVQLFRSIAFSNGRYICDPSGILSTDSVVGFYTFNNSLETLICYGRVETISSQGFAQIIPIIKENIEFNVCDYIESHISKIVIHPILTTITEFQYYPTTEEEI